MSILFLLACTPTSPEPAVPPPPPVVEPAPAPEPPAEVFLPIAYDPADLSLTEGETLQALCGARLHTTTVQRHPTPEGHTTLRVEACETFELLLRGVDKRVGSGSVVVGEGTGPVGFDAPLSVRVGFGEARVAATRVDDGYRVELVGGRGPSALLWAQESATDPQIHVHWFGDLDDDHVPDLALQTTDADQSTLHLFLSAANPDQQPTRVAHHVYTPPNPE